MPENTASIAIYKVLFLAMAGPKRDCARFPICVVRFLAVRSFSSEANLCGRARHMTRNHFDLGAFTHVAILFILVVIFIVEFLDIIGTRTRRNSLGQNSSKRVRFRRIDRIVLGPGNGR
jgi:hypothetical protein